MRRFLVHITILIAGAALLYLPTVWLVGRTTLGANVKYLPRNYGHSDLRMEEADRLNPPEGLDILFIGSSHCYRTFDTRAYDSCGYRTFNLGSSNQTPRQTYAMLSRYLGNWRPRLVVVEVHPDIMGNSGEESAVDIVSNTHIDAPTGAMVLSQGNLCVFNTMCCSMVDRLARRGRESRGDSIRTVRTQSGDTTVTVDFAYVEGGYVEVTPYCYKPTPLAPKSIETRADQLEWLGKCLELLDRHSTPYLLVEVPSTRGRYHSYTNHKEFEAKIGALTGSGGEYLNLNEERRLMELLDDTTCYFDDDHLNQRGANIFNKFFIQCILSD